MTANSETRVVHINDRIEGAVYIGRSVPRRKLTASKWANPFKIGQTLTPRDIPPGYIYPTGPMDRADVVQMYWAYLQTSPLLSELPELRGQALACWCRHDGGDQTPANACHGDVLIALLDSHTDDELIAMAPLFDLQACRVCGCTDDAACEGGCYWIEPDLCSECAKAEGIEPTVPEWRMLQRVADLERRMDRVEANMPTQSEAPG